MTPSEGKKTQKVGSTHRDHDITFTKMSEKSTLLTLLHFEINSVLV